MLLSGMRPCLSGVSLPCRVHERMVDAGSRKPALAHWSLICLGVPFLWLFVVFVWVWSTGPAFWLLASGELEVESSAFEHDEADEVVEVPVAVADLDGGLDLVCLMASSLALDSPERMVVRMSLANIAPYREPKRGQSMYGPYDPNNVNSLAYLMRHMHPDKVGQGHKLLDPGTRKSGKGMAGEKIRAFKTMTPRTSLKEITHDEVNPLWDTWIRKKLDNGYRPDFSKNPWGINCQRVVQAAELRFRGYDVQAVGNHKSSSDGYYWNIADLWVDRNGNHRKFTQKETNNATIRAMREYPPGSRFFVAGPWKNGGAHIWNAEVVQMPSGWKSVRMYDYQPGDYTKYEYKNGKIPDCYPDDIKEGQLRFLRVDDMEPTDSLLEGGRPSFTDAPAYAKPWVGDPDTVRSWSEWKLQRTHRDDTSWRRHQDEYDKWAESTPPSQGGQA